MTEQRHIPTLQEFDDLAALISEARQLSRELACTVGALRILERQIGEQARVVSAYLN